MATPQLENGYIRIANELFQQFCSLTLSPSEWKILNFVLWKTYGYNKKEDWISLSQFENGCLLDRSQVCKTIKKLLSKQVLIKNDNKYSFNKNSDSWEVSEPTPVSKQTLVSKQTISSVSLDNLGSVQTDTHNSTILHKTIIQQDYSSKEESAELKEPPKVDKRNPGIDNMLNALKGRIGISAFVDSTIERNMAKHCVNLLQNLGKEEFVRRLDILREDSFHYKNLNKIRYIYNNIKGFIEPKAQKSTTAFIS